MKGAAVQCSLSSQHAPQSEAELPVTAEFFRKMHLILLVCTSDVGWSGRICVDLECSPETIQPIISPLEGSSDNSSTGL